jgi:SpoVK/Ycf46/Vps4 family AAA+-type ATPase
MTQVDGIVKDGGACDNGKHLLLIACTNCPGDIDLSVLRFFPTRIYIPLPDRDTRKALLKNILTKAGRHELTSSVILKRPPSNWAAFPGLTYPQSHQKLPLVQYVPWEAWRQFEELKRKGHKANIFSRL